MHLPGCVLEVNMTCFQRLGLGDNGEEVSGASAFFLRER